MDYKRSLVSALGTSGHEKCQISKILKFIHVYFGTTMQKFLIMACKGNSWVPNDCVLKLGEPPLISWEMMCYQIFQFCILKYFAENYDNLKFQDTSKVVIFR